MNLKRTCSKVKGFTLVELIVVMAIIAILAGTLSMFIQGFQRDARLESNNNKAQLLFTGMQNQLIQCEINQDRSLFDAGAHYSTPVYTDKNLAYVELFFQMKEGKVSDTIYVYSKYSNGSTLVPAGLDATRTSTSTSAWHAELEKAILSFVDNTFEGVCAVYIDYEDYLVDSAIVVENGSAGNVDLKVYTTGSNGIGQLMYSLNPYCPYDKESGETMNDKQFRLLTSISAQETAIERDGIYFGAYPNKMALS